MARWDAAELLSKCKTEMRRPVLDELMANEVWYEFLSQAQEYWMQEMAVTVARANYGPPTKMATADGGVTYTFGTDADTDNLTPLGEVEIRESLTGRVLKPGLQWDDSTLRYVHEGDHIRWADSKKRTFADGPYARFVAPPGVIDGTHPPVLKPKQARALVLYRALVLACEGPLRQDPARFLQKETELWHGAPNIGRHGLLGALRNQFYGQTEEGLAGSSKWYPVDDGSSYTKWVG